MKKTICLALVITIMVMFCACGRKAGEDIGTTGRFYIITGDNPNAPYHEMIIVDRDTGVLYLALYAGRHFGITPLLDSEMDDGAAKCQMAMIAKCLHGCRCRSRRRRKDDGN